MSSTPNRNKEAEELATPDYGIIKSLIKRTNKSDRGKSYVLDTWHALQLSDPTSAQFISTVAYMSAPDDPELRETIATSMVKLIILQDEKSIHKELNDSLSESVGKYFSIKTSA
jgi:hypothetical protein